METDNKETKFTRLMWIIREEETFNLPVPKKIHKYIGVSSSMHFQNLTYLHPSLFYSRQYYQIDSSLVGMHILYKCVSGTVLQFSSFGLSWNLPSFLFFVERGNCIPQIAALLDPV